MVGRVENQMDFWDEFDIAATASFIVRSGYERVALQFPDELLQHSVAVSSALKREISRQKNEEASRLVGEQGDASLRLFVMADTTFGSCCADEVAAMHADAQCVVHYGHTCLSMTSRLPVWFVFGRAAIDAERCAARIGDLAADKQQKRILVLFGPRYIYAVRSIQEKVYALTERHHDITLASPPSQLMKPFVGGGNSSENHLVGKVASMSSEQGECSSFGVGQTARENPGKDDGHLSKEETKYKIGGLEWIVPGGVDMENYVILWIGSDDPGLTNVSLVFNSSTIVRYDALDDKIVTDVTKQSKLLQRRYYLVERAKDASVVGIVVGTLGVAGYGEAIQRIRTLIEAAGKKAYTLVMGKPNPAKLANFPECEIFVLVACPQTALIDSKEYFAPLITPFESELAFAEGKLWTGAYQVDFSAEPAFAQRPEESSLLEPRFSFLKGGYVGENSSQDEDVEDPSSREVALSHASQHAVQLQSDPSRSIITTERSVLDLKSGAEYLASRTYRGLDINHERPQDPRKTSQVIAGRKGRAAAYQDEPKNNF